MKKTGIIILAAGDSGRLGQPKQLLKIGDTNLLNHSVASAVNTSAEQVILVLGANFNLIIPELEKSPAIIVRNPDWHEGVASSIRMGLQTYLDLKPDAEAVILMVCDQPYISEEVLESILKTSLNSSAGIIASEYQHQPGTPALFRRKYFGDLLNLHGDRGAKPILEANAADLVTVPFEMGYLDIDTKNDIDKMNDII